MRICYTAVVLVILAISSSSAWQSNDNRYWGGQTKAIKGAQVAERVDIYPRKIQELYGNKKIHVYRIDLDKDGTPDYIAREESGFKTCFVKSDLSIIGCERLGYGDGFQYYWFVNIEGDPMLQLISLVGDEDSSDYCIYRFDKKTWRRNQRVRIAPVIFSKSKQYKGIYWGYPWDISGLVSKRATGANGLYCCISELKKIDEESRDTLFVAFEGLPTQGDFTGHYTYLEKKFRFQNAKDLKQYYEDLETEDR